MATTPLCAIPNEGRGRKRPLSLVLRRRHISQRTGPTHWTRLHKLAERPPPLPFPALRNSADATRPVSAAATDAAHTVEFQIPRTIGLRRSGLWAPVRRFRIRRRCADCPQRGERIALPQPWSQQPPRAPHHGREPRGSSAPSSQPHTPGKPIDASTPK